MYLHSKGKEVRICWDNSYEINFHLSQVIELLAKVCTDV